MTTGVCQKLSGLKIRRDRRAVTGLGPLCGGCGTQGPEKGTRGGTKLVSVRAPACVRRGRARLRERADAYDQTRSSRAEEERRSAARTAPPRRPCPVRAPVSGMPPWCRPAAAARCRRRSHGLSCVGTVPNEAVKALARLEVSADARCGCSVHGTKCRKVGHPRRRDAIVAMCITCERERSG